MDAYHDKFALIDPYIADGGIYHPESMLKWVLDHAGAPVKRTSIIFDTLRKNGDRIRPCWEKMHGDVLPVKQRTSLGEPQPA